MNILGFIPNGWLTYLGAASKGLAALLALLTAIQGGDVGTIAHQLEAIGGLFGLGSALSVAGLRRAIANMAAPPSGS